MNKNLLCFTAVLLALATAGPARAGTTNFTFQTDPTQLNLDGTRSMFFGGSHNHANPAGASYCWSSTNGAGGIADGYLSLVDNIASMGLVAVVPPLDTNAPVAAFTIDMDLRVGNPTNANSRPADGWSVSFCRPTDMVVSNATPFGNFLGDVMFGFGGGGSLFEARSATPGTGMAESGTKSGIAFSFDAYQGGWLPDGLTNTAGTTDMEGIAFRVDDMTLMQVPLPDRNGNCSNTTCQATACADLNSLQTGPFIGTTNRAGYANLCWKHLTIRMTNNQFTVIWKGNTVISTNYPYWSPTAGQLVIAARTGGNCQNVHVDNVAITTYPVNDSYLANITGTPVGFNFGLSDYGNAVTTISQVVLDGTNDVTALTSATKSGTLMTAIVTLPTNLVSYTRHTAAIVWQTDASTTVTATNAFVVPAYVNISTNGVLPLSAIDTTKPGFSVNAWQTRQRNPNSLPWTEQQVLGLRGTNAIGTPLVPSEGGLLVWDGAMDFWNQGTTTASGYFLNNYDFNLFGMSANPPGSTKDGLYDQIAAEFFGYIYFPTSGFYNFVVGSDDSYQLSLSQSPYDRMGTVLSFLQGSRLPTVANPPNVGGVDVRTYYISQSGCYPFRLLYENGAGQAGIEWYTYDPYDSAVPYKLVNDTNTPGALLTYRATASAVYGPYVKQAEPVPNDLYVTFYQPVTVDLADGTGNLAIDTNTISLNIDGTPQAFTLSKAGDTTHIVQVMTNYWINLSHTNLVTFNDLNGTNYSYSWTFTVMTGGAGSGVGYTNVILSNSIVTLPLAARVDPGTLSQPGVRIHSHQMYFKQPNSVGTTEEEFEGLHGPNIANQSGTNGPGFFVWNDVLDLRKASGTGTGAGGEYNYDTDYSVFGMVALQAASSGNNVDNCALEIGSYFVFPSAGLYILHMNTDDGFGMTVPLANNIFNKSGMPVLTRDTSGSMAGEVTSGLAGGYYAAINVPSAGAYPIRVVYEGGAGDQGFEWSAYQFMPDGTVAKLLINDLGYPASIKAYQVSSAASGPWISYMNPARLAKDVVFYQPIVVDITDGSYTTDNTKIDSLTVDGVAQGFTAYKTNGNTTHIVQTMTAPWVHNSAHTNVLIYHDSAANVYSNYWVFTVMNISPFGVVQLPLTNAVPYSALDLAQPGYRVRSYQVITNTLGNNVPGWEGVLEGLSGANIADLSMTNGPGFFTNSLLIDFANNVTGGADAPSGEWEYDYNFSTFGAVYNPNTSASLENYFAMELGTYLYFPRAGNYIMEVNNDDDYRLISPYGNPFNKFGTFLGSQEGGHGAANAGFGPRGGTAYFVFNVPAPAAYPFRMLFANITGGSGLEWNIFQYLPDGSVAQVLIGDTNTPGAIQLFQVSSQDTPYVSFLSPVPGNVYGPNAPAITLSGNAIGNLAATTNGPVQQDIIIGLADAITAVNPNTVQLSFNGILQPTSVVQSNGLTYVIRPANSPQWWPSGQVGPLVLTFQDNTSRTITMVLTTIATPFWGTLANGLPLGRGDTNRGGFLMRTYAIDQQGSTSLPTRIHVAEQALAGIWGPNNINTANNYGMATLGNYFVDAGVGRLLGVPNFTIGRGQSGNFQSATNSDQLFPGIADLDGIVNNRSNSFAVELLAYVEFPTAGTYTLGVNSDDGFRLTQGFAPPANKGALLVNSPASLAGFKPTAQDTFLASYSLTNFVTGNAVLVQGPYAGGSPPNLYGSTNHNGLGYSIDGCIINNGPQLAGNIALMYRSAYCSYAQQVQSAAAAGAIAVVLIQNRTNSNGWFPEEAGVTPMQPIPAVMIDQTNGDNLIAALATNAVNVTLTPMDYLINPPPAESPLGQADVGRGTADSLFPVVVPQAGVYPLRLLYYQGGGGAGMEFFSVTNGQRVLINDRNFPLPYALKAYYGLAAPTLSITSDGVNLTITYTGTLLSSPNVGLPLSSWTPVAGSSPLVIPIASAAAQQYYRAVLTQ